ncbi:flagellar protein FliT [Allopusillimonas soli]|uniref:Flagellar protein FliT n=1 Tax=Allopusillimonas soli TaxID=659016 RepID=A0A853F981_9BURK|nr:flagellar protein FliT [Allopusillimonas soli]NYT35500.1 flagellar protein FliT [Allopusillimonas soli]
MNTSVLGHYETIARISHRMLDEAQAKRWDQVLSLGEQYRQAVEVLRNQGVLSDNDREARRALISGILDDDARIRALIFPELERLGTLIGDLRHQRNVLQSYCKQSGHP